MRQGHRRPTGRGGMDARILRTRADFGAPAVNVPIQVVCLRSSTFPRLWLRGGADQLAFLCRCQVSRGRLSSSGRPVGAASFLAVPTAC